MKSFLSFFKKAHALVRPGTHTHPTRDWFMLTGLSALLVGLSAGWNAWAYVESTVRDSTTDTPAYVTTFDTSVVESVQSIFNARKEEADRYGSTYRFVDPSR